MYINIFITPFSIIKVLTYEIEINTCIHIINTFVVEVVLVVVHYLLLSTVGAALIFGNFLFGNKKVFQAWFKHE